MFMNEPIIEFNSAPSPTQSLSFRSGETIDINFSLFTRRLVNGDPLISFQVQKETGNQFTPWTTISNDALISQGPRQKLFQISNASQSDAGTYRIEALRGASNTSGQLSTMSETFILEYESTATAPTLTDVTIQTVSGVTRFQGGSSYSLKATASYLDRPSEVRSVTWSSTSSLVDLSDTGQITLLPVGTSQEVQITATLTHAGVTQDWSQTFTIVPASTINPDPEPEPPVEIVENGGFEEGLDGWISTGDFQADSRFSNANTGTEYAYLANPDGTPGNNLLGTVRQEYSIPASAASATLRFHRWITTTEVDNAPNDFLSVQILDEDGQNPQFLKIFSDLDATSAYRGEDIDISDWIGKDFSVQFLAITNANFPTVFRIDDVSVSHQEAADLEATQLTITGPGSLDENTSGNYQAVLTLDNGDTQNVSVNWSENSSSLTVSSSGRVSASSVSSNRTGTLTATYSSGGTTLTATKEITVIDNAGASGFSMEVTKENGSVIRLPHHSRYQPGTEVRLTAKADPGYEFAGWQGDITGNDSRVYLTMNSNKTFTAIFTPIPPGYGSLTVSISPPEAVAAGARWRVDGGPWITSGTTTSGIQEGPHYLEFAPVANWGAPPVREISVNPLVGNSESGTYSSSTGVPIISSISPFAGTLSGGTTVAVTGTNLNQINQVLFGSTPGTIESSSANQLVITSPASSSYGSVDLSFVSPSGTTRRPAGFTYQELDQFNFQVHDQVGGDIESVALDGTYAYINEGPTLIELNVSNPSSPTELARVRVPGAVRDIQIQDGLAYLSCGRNGIVVVDISTKGAPRLIGQFETEGSARGARLNGDYLYVASETGGLAILNISNPANIKREAALQFEGLTSRIAYFKQGFKDFVVLSENILVSPRLWIVEVTAASNPILTNTLSASARILSIETEGSLLITSENYSSRLWDLSDVSSPTAGNLRPGRGARMVFKVGQELVSLGDGQVTRYSISGQTQLTEISRESWPIDLDDLSSAVISENQIYVADDSVGFTIFGHSNHGSLVTRSQVAVKFVANSVSSTGNEILVSYSEGIASLRLNGDSLQYRNSSPHFWSSTTNQNSIASIGNTVVDTTNGEKVFISQLAANGSVSQRAIWNDASTGGSNESSFFDVEISGTTAYLVGNREQTSGTPRSRIVAISLANPSAPQLLGGVDGLEGSLFHRTDKSGDILVCSGFTGAAIVDISTPSNPQILSEIERTLRFGCAVSGNYAFFGTGLGIDVYDIQQPDSPELIFSGLGGSPSRDIEIEGDFLYHLDSSSKIDAYRILDTGNLEKLGSLVTGGFAARLHTIGDKLLIADQRGGVVLSEVIDKATPDLLITQPSEAAITTEVQSISVGGLASDDHELRSIEWTSSNGQSGTASGLTQWFIPNIPLDPGVNTITVTAVDAYANRLSQSINVTFDAPDTTPPSLSVSGPPTRSVTENTILIQGTATDSALGDSGITSVLVGNLQADNDFSEGSVTASWSATYPLLIGENIIVIEATDGSAAENSEQQTITVTYTPDSSTFEGWVFNNNLPVNLSGPNDDPFGTGISNLLTFALGTSVIDPDLNSLPVYKRVEVDGEYYHALRFHRSREATGLAFRLQRSVSLDGFEDETSFVLEPIGNISAQQEEVIIRATNPIQGDENIRFFRLNVSKE